MSSGTEEVVPPGIDISRPQAARMYDYFLGGKDNFAIDRETADKALSTLPLRTTARENRAFLGRAVSYLLREAGIRQFLDIGTGLPSVNNTHEVAQRIAPESRVVYVDNDPLVLAHARALLTSTPAGRTAYVQADLREPERILADPVVRDVLDFTRPVALMLAAVLHFLADDDDPAAVVDTLLRALPPGSYLVASHASAEYNPEAVSAAERAYHASGVAIRNRTAEEFGRLFFSGLDPVSPGVVLVSEWRPEDATPRPKPEEVNGNAAVARKP